MCKRILNLLLFLPSFCFSQDTLFNKTLTEITVRSAGKKESVSAVIGLVRNSSVVSDGLSSESIKRTPDRTVGDVLKRINGLTVQNEKFVLVRGLGDRYNSAILNKTILPSTEPDRRSFSFDLIPSSVIDNITVSKSASASLPGDFGGGVIQITTKEVSTNFSSLSFGTSCGTISSFVNYKLVDRFSFPENFPSTYQFRIGTNGDKRAYTKIIQNPATEGFLSPANFNANYTLGIKRSKWNTLLLMSSRLNFNRSFTERKDYQSSTELAYNYRDTLFTRSISYNGLVNVTFLGENRFSWKTLFNNQIENSFLQRQGSNYDNIQEINSFSSNHVVKSVVNSQIDGKIKNLDFNLGWNLILRDQPDYRVNPLTKSLGSSTNYTTAWRDTYRFWSILDENSFNGSVNKDFGDLKIGAFYLKKIRNFQARVFRYDAADLLDEITNNTDRYDANFDLYAGYVQFDRQWKGWRINSGLRTEINQFTVNTSDFSGESVKVQRRYPDLLPSMNLSYVWKKHKFRLSGSKTLSRPEFREVANFAYYDFVRNAQLIGNPLLEKTDIYNLDLKWEIYPSASENFSFALFGKRFENPIEQIVADGSVPSNLLLTYTNPQEASVYGFEIELRKNLSKWIEVYANTTISNSQVEVNDNKRQLQGQSNYVLNGGIKISKNKNTLVFSYNRVGDRISAVGFQGYPDIFENSRDVVDVVFLRKIKIGEVKFSIGDVLAQPTKFYQKINKRDLIVTNNEQSISLNININL